MAKVLVVDDNADEAESLSKVLGLHGHEVVTTNNGRDALMQVLANPPDVILLDMILPEMDGPSFLEVVRSYLRLQALPVVVITGVPDSPMVARTQSLKVNCILAKGKATTEDIVKAVDEAVVRVPG